MRSIRTVSGIIRTLLATWSKINSFKFMTGGLKKTTDNFGFRVTMDAIRRLSRRCLENQNPQIYSL
jgi:hypothetical protein